MEKHTKGPWRIVTTSYHPHIHINAGDSFRPEIICSMDGHKGDIDDANARLIAAAPEMLEALKIVRITLQQVVKDNALNIAAKNDLQRINKVIQKTEGGR